MMMKELGREEEEELNQPRFEECRRLERIINVRILSGVRLNPSKLPHNHFITTTFLRGKMFHRENLESMEFDCTMIPQLTHDTPQLLSLFHFTPIIHYATQSFPQTLNLLLRPPNSLHLCLFDSPTNLQHSSHHRPSLHLANEG